MDLNIYPAGTITQRTIFIAINYNNLYLPNGKCTKVKQNCKNHLNTVYNNHIVGGSLLLF